MAKKEDDITYHVIRRGGADQRVTVPASWKVTFGPVNPGKKGEYSPNGSPYCLRFYEAANKQRMVITEVVSFRDTSIPVQEKRTSVKQQTMYKDTDKGKKNVVVEGRVTEWVNPDAPEADKPDKQFLSLEYIPEEDEGTI